jgi:riboflavin synthase
MMEVRHVDKIGIVDTTFARFDMGAIAEAELSHQSGFRKRFEIVRTTVPGIKDLAVACKRLIERENCSIVLAFGMPGRADLDRQSAQEASLGLMAAQLLTSTSILQVFVHETESEDPEELRNIARHRSARHALNAYWMLYEPKRLRERAGKGIRQGPADVGPW